MKKALLLFAIGIYFRTIFFSIFSNNLEKWSGNLQIFYEKAEDLEKAFFNEKSMKP